jgi:hypothetical protein
MLFYIGTKWGIYDLDSLPNKIQHPAQIDNRVECITGSISTEFLRIEGFLTAFLKACLEDDAIHIFAQKLFNPSPCRNTTLYGHMLINNGPTLHVSTYELLKHSKNMLWI